MPEEVLPKTSDEAADLLLAALAGVTQREERLSLSSAWPFYFTLVDIISSSMSDEDANALLEAFAMPPVNQYLHPTDESAQWTIGGAHAARLVSQVMLVKSIPPLLERKWPHLAEKLIEVARASLPEQSKDFEKSQRHVI